VGFGIPEEKIRLVQSLNDVVDVVSQYVPLKRRGRDFRALCPFHSEKTPSFYVSPSKQIYKCFGCGAGGDVFSFVMAIERVQFPEAIRILARRAGVDLEQDGTAHGTAPSVKERLYHANSWALAIFRQALSGDEGALARDWLHSRGIDPASTAKFQLGYAPDSWSTLVDKVAGDAGRLSVLEQAGLAVRRDDGSGHYDRFRNRLIFPIFDIRGRPIAFGGRSLDGSEPKYLNSPETPVFTKGATLYGLNWAAAAARSTNRIAVVEGYTDVIMAHAAGLEWVVATLGTSLTGRHARTLRRYADVVSLVFDGDAAGLKAADRALAAFMDEDVETKVTLMPDGLDPAEYVVQRGAEAFASELERATDILDFKLRFVRGEYDVATTTGRARAVDDVLDLVRRCARNPVRQSDYLRRVAEDFGLAEQAVRKRLRSLRRFRSHAPADQGVEMSPSPDLKAEEEILEAALNEPRLRARLHECPKGIFRDESNAVIAEVLEELGEEADTPTVTAQLHALGRSEAAEKVAVMAAGVAKSSQSYEMQMKGALNFIEKEQLRRRRDQKRRECWAPFRT